MKDEFWVLAVEDNPDHLADLREMLTTELPKFPVQVKVLVAQNLKEAIQMFPDVDAVMTDVLFPASADEDPNQPNGKQVAECAIREERPVVLVTSRWHHDKLVDATCAWSEGVGLTMFDCPNMGDGEEGPHKPWKEALYGVIYLAICLEEKICRFEDGVLKKEGQRGHHLALTPIYAHDPTSDDLGMIEMDKRGFPRF